MKDIMKVSITTVTILSTLVFTHPAHASVSMDTVLTMKGESEAAKYNKATAGQSVVYLDNDIKTAFNNNRLISVKKLNTEMLKLINSDRKSLGMRSLKYAVPMQKGTNTRAMELVNTEVFSHYRPNGTTPSTAFNGIKGVYQFGENILSRRYNNNPYTILSEKYIAQELYRKWFSSTEHKKNLERPTFRSTAVAVKFTKINSTMPNKMYAVQVFTNKSY